MTVIVRGILARIMMLMKLEIKKPSKKVFVPTNDPN